MGRLKLIIMVAMAMLKLSLTFVSLVSSIQEEPSAVLRMENTMPGLLTQLFEAGGSQHQESIEKIEHLIGKYRVQTKEQMDEGKEKLKTLSAQVDKKREHAAATMATSEDDGYRTMLSAYISSLDQYESGTLVQFENDLKRLKRYLSDLDLYEAKLLNPETKKMTEDSESKPEPSPSSTAFKTVSMTSPEPIPATPAPTTTAPTTSGPAPRRAYGSKANAEAAQLKNVQAMGAGFAGLQNKVQLPASNMLLQKPAWGQMPAFPMFPKKP